MKILNTNQFIAERIKVQAVSNRELDVIQKKYGKCRYFPKTRDELKNVIDYHLMYDDETKYNFNDIYTGEVTDMSYIFGSMYQNFDVSEWDVSKVTNMKGMFWGCKKFNCDISKWDVSNVTDMSKMFCNAESFNQSLDAWKDKIAKVTNMECMFMGANSLDQNLSSWNILSNVKHEHMFSHCPIEHDESKQPNFNK